MPNAMQSAGWTVLQNAAISDGMAYSRYIATPLTTSLLHERTPLQVSSQLRYLKYSRLTQLDASAYCLYNQLTVARII